MLTYCNPVYTHYFADPFVWQHDGVYYAVGTGPIEPGGAATPTTKIQSEWRAFPLLISRNFVDWKFHSGALRVPPGFEKADFWAPEVAVVDGRFYLYYSTALKGIEHQLRVAISSRPEGPYEDVGNLMSSVEECPFAIDAHPFQDEDGSWYLFYARDFLDESEEAKAGTALVMDRLIGMVRLAGDEKVVMRSRCSWQLFKAQRTMYGQVFDWHTMEGPCVRKKNGVYYCFYSGGCFENDSYGVDYGISDSVTGPYSDKGSEIGPRVLKTVPRQVIGPGHQSIAVGPDGHDYMVYHAWDPGMTARRMCLDRIAWRKEGPRCVGPTWTPQMIDVPDTPKFRMEKTSVA